MSDMVKATEILRRAKKVVFFTGAGISAESGIPTFRDTLNGLWEKYDPERLETAAAFRENPALVWGWYLWRRRQASQAEPNAAHLMVPRLARGGRRVAVVTQNIDDLHERSGSEDVVHLHGSLAQPKCFACHRSAELAPAEARISSEGEAVEPPRCAKCNGRMRPSIVWFKEDLPAGAWKKAITLIKDCDVLISVGTSGIIMPAADIPEIALAAGATVIHVNLHDVSLGNANELMLIGKASVVLSLLLDSLGSE